MLIKNKCFIWNTYNSQLILVKSEFGTIIHKRFELFLIAKTSKPIQFFWIFSVIFLWFFLFTCDRFGGFGNVYFVRSEQKNIQTILSVACFSVQNNQFQLNSQSVWLCLRMRAYTFVRRYVCTGKQNDSCA